MELLLAMTGKDPEPWLTSLRQALPDARVRVWAEGDSALANYALVWKPAPAVLRGQGGLSAIFNMGAGVDGILDLDANHPGAIPQDVPIYRIEDAGMAAQMVEYACYATLRYFRRFDDYELQRRECLWKPLEPRVASDFVVGILGLGSLGAAVAAKLASFGLAVRGHSRTPKSVEGVHCFCGEASFDAFLDGVQVLINLLPNTPETRGVLGAKTFAKLGEDAYIVNLARGVHLVEDELMHAIRTGRISGAMLDVFSVEPLPSMHPFWTDPRITITPHISAQTLLDESIKQVARKIAAIESGLTPTGKVDLVRGY